MRETFEPRDALGSRDECSEVVWFYRFHYKPFGGIRPARPERMETMSKPLAQELEWAAFVAIDWADQKHVWALAEAGSEHDGD